MDLRIWVEGTVVAAMAMALSFLPIEFANSGLDLSLGMVPLVLYSFRRGLLPGVAAGFVWGMLNIILGTAMKNFLSVPQIIFEYPFAFASLFLCSKRYKYRRQLFVCKSSSRLIGKSSTAIICS